MSINQYYDLYYVTCGYDDYADYDGRETHAEMIVVASTPEEAAKLFWASFPGDMWEAETHALVYLLPQISDSTESHVVPWGTPHTIPRSTAT